MDTVMTVGFSNVSPHTNVYTWMYPDQNCWQILAKTTLLKINICILSLILFEHLEIFFVWMFCMKFFFFSFFVKMLG